MYDLTIGQNRHFNQNNQPKKTMSFMPHTFSQSEHPFSQCRHINQVEPFKKSWFLLIFGLGEKYLFYEIFVVKKKETREDKKAREFEALLEFLVF
jgi:hypothetical protein